MPKLNCDIDMSNLYRMMKDIDRLEEREVVVSVDDTPSSGNPDVTNLEVASWMENGVRAPDGGYHTVPRKFFFRGAVICEGEIHKESKLVVENTLKHNEALVNRDLQKIGDIGINSVQEAIDRQGFAELAPTTINIKRSKGSRYATTALIDTTGLYDAINFKIK